MSKTTTTEAAQSSALTSHERERLVQCEAKLGTHADAQFDAGRALAEIRDARLYRATHGTFESYAKQKWDFGRRRAEQLIKAAKLIDTLKSRGATNFPPTEAYARPLTTLSVTEAEEVWAATVKKWGESLTAKKVSAAVEVFKKVEKEAAIQDGGTVAVLSPKARAFVEGPKSKPGTKEHPIEDIGLTGKSGGTTRGLLISAHAAAFNAVGIEPKRVVIGMASELKETLSKDAIHELVRQMADGGYKARFNLQKNDSIGWALWSWNPFTGCGLGCKYCYAAEIADRFYPQGFAPTLHVGRLLAPEHTTVPERLKGKPGARRVFVNSMGDWMDPAVPDVVIEAILDVCRKNPEWQFLTLTKQPKRLADFSYPDNVWVGVTVTKQAMVKPMEEAFSEIDAKVRWLSCEPLLGSVVLNSPEVVEQIVIGAQTAANGEPERQPDREWVDTLVQQARREGIPIWEKLNLKHEHYREMGPRPRTLSTPGASDRGPISGANPVRRPERRKRT